MQITPTNVSLRAREAHVFQAAGAAATVVWSVEPEVGRIDQNGVYRAPLLVPRTASLIVRAQDGNQVDTANVTLDPGCFWLNVLGCYWLVWAALLVASLVGRWDVLCQNCTPAGACQKDSVSGTASLIALIALAGALGGLIHGASSFAIFAGNRAFQSSWIWWSVLRPVLGAAVALVVYLVVPNGLGTGGMTLAGADCLKTAGFAGLIGMFAEPATLKLKDIFETVFTPRADPRKDVL